MSAGRHWGLCWLMTHFLAVLSHSIVSPATELEEWSPLLSDFSKNVDAVIAPLFKPLVVSANGILSNCSQNELTQRHRAQNLNKYIKKKKNSPVAEDIQKTPKTCRCWQWMYVLVGKSLRMPKGCGCSDGEVEAQSGLVLDNRVTEERSRQGQWNWPVEQRFPLCSESRAQLHSPCTL